MYGLKHHIVEINEDVTNAGRRDATTSEYRATQLLICEKLILAIISSYHSTINLNTTSMGAESFVKPKKYIAGISDLAALARHSLGS